MYWTTVGWPVFYAQQCHLSKLDCVKNSVCPRCGKQPVGHLKATHRLLSDPRWYFRPPSSFFMGAKQDKCETHVSSHKVWSLTSRADTRQRSSHRAVTCHKSLSPWIITRPLPSRDSTLRSKNDRWELVHSRQSRTELTRHIYTDTREYKSSTSKIMNYLCIKYTLTALLIYYDINYNGLFDILIAGLHKHSFKPLSIIKVDQNVNWIIG